jgi:hypothetical protein
MAARSLGFDGNRKLTITSMGAPADHSLQPSFVTLLPAYSAAERQQAAGVTKELINLGCVEFCCVGPEAELLHDALDEVIEAEGALEVVTTWIEDATEGSEYFLHAAAGGRVNLLALIDAHPELQVILEEDARRAGYVEPPDFAE